MKNIRLPTSPDIDTLIIKDLVIIKNCLSILGPKLAEPHVFYNHLDKLFKIFATISEFNLAYAIDSMRPVGKHKIQEIENVLPKEKSLCEEANPILDDQKSFEDEKFYKYFNRPQMVRYYKECLDTIGYHCDIRLTIDYLLEWYFATNSETKLNADTDHFDENSNEILFFLNEILGGFSRKMADDESTRDKSVKEDGSENSEIIVYLMKELLPVYLSLRNWKPGLSDPSFDNQNGVKFSTKSNTLISSNFSDIKLKSDSKIEFNRRLNGPLVSIISETDTKPEKMEDDKKHFLEFSALPTNVSTNLLNLRIPGILNKFQEVPSPTKLSKKQSQSSRSILTTLLSVEGLARLLDLLSHSLIKSDKSIKALLIKKSLYPLLVLSVASPYKPLADVSKSTLTSLAIAFGYGNVNRLLSLNAHQLINQVTLNIEYLGVRLENINHHFDVSLSLDTCPIYPNTATHVFTALINHYTALLDDYKDNEESNNIPCASSNTNSKAEILVSRSPQDELTPLARHALLLTLANRLRSHYILSSPSSKYYSDRHSAMDAIDNSEIRSLLIVFSAYAKYARYYAQKCRKEPLFDATLLAVVEGNEKWSLRKHIENVKAKMDAERIRESNHDQHEEKGEFVTPLGVKDIGDDDSLETVQYSNNLLEDKETPLYVGVIKEAFDLLPKFLYHEDLTVKAIVLNTLEDGIVSLLSFPDIQLPLIHNLWIPTKSCLSTSPVGSLSFPCLIRNVRVLKLIHDSLTLTSDCRDFVKSRVLKEVIKPLMLCYYGAEVKGRTGSANRKKDAHVAPVKNFRNEPLYLSVFSSFMKYMTGLCIKLNLPPDIESDIITKILLPSFHEAYNPPLAKVAKIYLDEMARYDPFMVSYYRDAYLSTKTDNKNDRSRT
ncbi:uncharacterized protein LOC135929734 [Gordionus sp. m RMFG-2023]|uniref:uncharacterized protein LOC135929734 n=1 Tax=Gordionus sp. m RMFG-2023 TaxID=3053472 RepID=UPI0031FE16BD